MVFFGIVIANFFRKSKLSLKTRLSAAQNPPKSIFSGKITSPATGDGAQIETGFEG